MADLRRTEADLETAAPGALRRRRCQVNQAQGVAVRSPRTDVGQVWRLKFASWWKAASRVELRLASLKEQAAQWTERKEHAEARDELEHLGDRVG